MEIEIVKVKFKNSTLSYDFSPNGIDLKVGDYVIVDTERGKDIAKVECGPVKIGADKLQSELKNVVKKATDKELEDAKRYDELASKLLPEIKKIVKSHNLNMKIVKVEASYDNSKLIVNFSSDDRVDFRELVKELASIYKKRIELRQIGPRDEVKILGGLGVCGKICCCTQNFCDFEHVSIKMAKNQNLSLNPNSISGLCGKLLCCLAYENDTYKEILSRMPKVNSVVSTKDGKGKVVFNDLLKERVSVRFEDENSSTITEYPLSEIKILGDK